MSKSVSRRILGPDTKYLGRFLTRAPVSKSAISCVGCMVCELRASCKYFFEFLVSPQPRVFVHRHFLFAFRCSFVGRREVIGCNSTLVNRERSVSLLARCQHWDDPEISLFLFPSLFLDHSWIWHFSKIVFSFFSLLSMRWNSSRYFGFDLGKKKIIRENYWREFYFVNRKVYLWKMKRKAKSVNWIS